jgi:hypothetical protein
MDNKNKLKHQNDMFIETQPTIICWKKECFNTIFKVQTKYHEIMGSSPGNSLLQKCREVVHIRPKVVGHFPVPYASRTYVHRAALLKLNIIYWAPRLNTDFSRKYQIYIHDKREKILRSVCYMHGLQYRQKYCGPDQFCRFTENQLARFNFFEILGNFLKNE